SDMTRRRAARSTAILRRTSFRSSSMRPCLLRRLDQHLGVSGLSAVEALIRLVGLLQADAPRDDKARLRASGDDRVAQEQVVFLDRRLPHSNRDALVPQLAERRWVHE